ncbi:MAG: HU family DNA-binding protein [Helicobacteraceae bacterium]|nr:HU family DNA-binding protein [Helicobacteraceae bacterium]
MADVKRGDLVAAIATKSETSKAAAERFLNATLDVITEEIKKGNKVPLVGFGTFEVKQRAARSGINPISGQHIDIPAKKAVVFRAGKFLKDAVA